jgi:hypothetical protein
MRLIDIGRSCLILSGHRSNDRRTFVSAGYLVTIIAVGIEIALCPA